MDIGQHIRAGMRLFSKKAITYVLAGGIVALGTSFTFGLLVGPLLGGLVYMGLGHHRTGRPPAVTDLSYGFQQFGGLFMFLIVPVLCFLGYLLLIIPGLVLTTWWMYAILLMVDRRMGLLEAMRESKARVTADSGFFPHLGFVILVFDLPVLLVHVLSASLPLLGILNFLILPIQFLALVSAYEAEFAQPPRMTYFTGRTFDV